MRKPIIAGNWKMNMTNTEAKKLIEEIIPLVKGAAVDVVVCPNFTCLTTAVELTKGTGIGVGAQNMHWEPKGAFTGETSVGMLRDLGVTYVIIGHSERRQYFAETDETVNKKVLAALENSLTPIVCVGESLEQREAGKAAEVVSNQTIAALKGVDPAQADRIVVAYEPIWAIGTGKTATAQDANEINTVIRETLIKLFGEETAAKMRIQYGGSMNAKNAAELMAQSNIDGGLIGGASLKAEDFSKIVFFDK
ncbi:MAG: triose-phosphate isomerase [Bacillota bacterium]